VTGIGALIHIYSLGYMAHDDDRPLFLLLNLFTFFMLLLVLGGSLPLLFWDGRASGSALLLIGSGTRRTPPRPPA